MLTLNADSACDVCAEEYGPFNLPRCIPCGHVLCATCADTIIDKASSSLALSSSRSQQQQQQQQHPQPLCPFCRESFTREGVRVIRIDFSGSSGGGVASSSGTGLNGGRGMGDTETCIDGGAFVSSMGMSMSMSGTLDDEMVLYDPRSRSPPSSRTSRDPSRATSPERTGPNGIFHTINEDHSSPLPLPANFDVNAHRERARELEKKVAKVACKRCSAEEVQALQRELGDWLSIDKILGSNGVAALDKQQHAAIHLSHLLIRAILMNHLAHSEASRVAKGAEAQLRARIADGELVREKLDADLRKAKKELAARMQENMALRAELARLKGTAANEDPTAHGHGEFRAVTPTRRQSLSAPTSPDGYFPSFAFSSTSSASTAVPPPSSSRSNPASGTNSPCSSGRTTPTAGLALGGGGGGGGGLGGISMMPMGSQMSIGMTLSSAGISPSPSMNGTGSGAGSGAGERAFMSTSGGMSSASASAAAANSTSTSSASAAAAGHRTFTISATPPRAQSTVPSPKGVSSASSASATTTPTRPQSTVPPRSQTPASPTRYGGGHARSASMIHRSATVVPGLSSSSASASASAASHAHSHFHSTSALAGRDRRSMTPAPPSLPHPGTGGPGPGPGLGLGLASSSPMHQRSASVAPGALSSASSAAAGRTLARSMTPNLRSSKDRENREKEGTGTGTGMGNGYSAGGTNTTTNGYGFSSASGLGQQQGGGGGKGIPPVPALPSLSSLGIPSSRPPVPPKPRTLSQSPSSQARGVVDDRDGYATERENASKKDHSKDGRDGNGNGNGKKERTIRHMHERWLPSALVDRMTRPATSQG